LKRGADMGRRLLLAAGVLVGLGIGAPGGASAQQPSSCPALGEGSGAVLHVRGAVLEPLTLSAPELDRLPRERVRVEERDGGVADYEGVALAAVLALAGVPTESLRGPQASTVVVAEALDGYRAAFALAELDAAFSDRRVLLVDRKNGAPLPAEEGPFRVVMEGERRHSRWIRQVVCLRVERL
jgi:DMSO/TMAO reductase YedYZ molybdopterin-dependent catalytic subunit